MFSILPGKEPKITFGGYQEEGKPASEHKFYSEVMHQIVAIRVSGSFHWELPLRNVNVGTVNFKS